jgi:hypothetical protein
MLINRTAFFDTIRPTLFKNGFSQVQVDSIDAIIDECEKQGIADNRQIAYIFATPYHECFNPHHPETRLTPIKEYGSDQYLKSKKYYPYIGRGFSGLTWKSNYEMEGERLGLDLINNPDMILDINIAANSHVYCMKHGRYTGRKLSDYINGSMCNFLGARKVINGIDKAELIAGYARSFLAGLN